jgi:DNA mismatch repair protein MutH
MILFQKSTKRVVFFMIYKTKEAVLNKSVEAIGIPFGEIDKHYRLDNAKGSIGQMMEESFFEYKVNSDSKPDFEEAGVELKVTPYLKNKNTSYSAKERLVLNIINYMLEITKTFETSSFWIKNKCIQMMFYEHFNDKPKDKYFISNTIQFSFPQNDLDIIIEDWNKIIAKIKSGQAESLSESDTLYLGACQKGKNRNSLRLQPFSNIKAMQRAYCLKQSYMTYILRNFVMGEKQDENVIKDASILKHTTFEEYIHDKIKKYIGMPQQELIKMFNITSNSKSINEIIVARMLDINGRVSFTSEFKKANIIPKTIRVNKNNKIIESMSFNTFKFKEIIAQEWEESDLYNTFSQTKFLFIIFKENENKELIFNNLMFWNMSINDLVELKKVWDKTIKVINDGVELTKINGVTYNNLPKKEFNSVGHVRPHAKNSTDTFELPDGRQLTKQCFWLNNNYIEKQLGLK